MKLLIFLLLSLLVLGGVVRAEEADAEGEQETLKYHIVVTATRTEQPELELGSSTTLISLEALKKAGKKTVTEALAAVPGLDVIQNGGAGKYADVLIRGAKSEHTLVMVDGIEMNDPASPGRTYDLAHMSLDNVERIEVVRGPQGTLYGSDAMGGVINIITKKGTGHPKINLSAEGGSYNSFRESAGISGGTENINYSFGVSRFDTKGFSASSEKYGNPEKDGYGNTTISAGLGVKAAKNMDIQFTTRYIDSHNELDGFAGEGGDDTNYVIDSRQFLFAANARYSLLNGKWNQRFGISYNNIHRDLDDPVDDQHPMDSSKGVYKGRVFKVDWQNNVYLHKTNTLTVGMEYEKEYGESEYSWESAWGPGNSDFPEQSARTMGIYIQDNIKIGETFFTTLGLRIDDHDRFGTETTFRIAPALVLKTGTKLKATYGTGFKAPSLYQLYAPATMWGSVGNENLEPEKSKGWDVGIEQYLFNDRLIVGVTYFRNDFESLIDYDWMMGYINKTEAVTKGFEVVFSASPLDNLDINGSYTYTDAKEKDTGEKLFRRPDHKANVTINYRFLKKANLGLNILHVGKRDDLFPYPTRTEADPYTLVNLSAGFRLTKSIEIFCRIDNILDEDYEAVLGYGTAGRSAYIGFRAAY